MKRFSSRSTGRSRRRRCSQRHIRLAQPPLSCSKATPIRQIAPNFVNTAVEIVKASSLLSAIGVAELLLTTQEIIGRTFKTMEFYALCGALYLAINLLIGTGGWWLERRFRLR